MGNKKIVRLFTAMLAVVLCTTAFAVPASAGGGDGEPYYTETTGTEAAPTGDAESPEVTVTDDEDTAGNNDTQAGADTLDQLAELLGGLGTVTVTEEGIQFTPDAEGLETQQIGTVTTCGGNLNVRTGAGLENDAFTQLPKAIPDISLGGAEQNMSRAELAAVAKAVAALSPEDRDLLAAVQESPFRLTTAEQFLEFEKNVDCFVLEPHS